MNESKNVSQRSDGRTRGGPSSAAVQAVWRIAWAGLASARRYSTGSEWQWHLVFGQNGLPVADAAWRVWCLEQGLCWRLAGVWSEILHTLREAERQRQGKEATPRIAIIDSQSIQNCLKGTAWFRCRHENQKGTSDDISIVIQTGYTSIQLQPGVESGGVAECRSQAGHWLKSPGSHQSQTTRRCHTVQDCAGTLTRSGRINSYIARIHSEIFPSCSSSR